MESLRFICNRRGQNKRQLGRPKFFRQHDYDANIRKPEKPKQLQRFATALCLMQILDCGFEIWVDSRQPSVADSYQSLELQLLGSQGWWK